MICFYCRATFSGGIPADHFCVLFTAEFGPMLPDTVFDKLAEYIRFKKEASAHHKQP